MYINKYTNNKCTTYYIDFVVNFFFLNYYSTLVILNVKNEPDHRTARSNSASGHCFSHYSKVKHHSSSCTRKLLSLPGRIYLGHHHRSGAPCLCSLSGSCVLWASPHPWDRHTLHCPLVSSSYQTLQTPTCAAKFDTDSI